MTAATAAAPRSTLAEALRRHWRLVGVAAVGIAPFGPSILAMDDFLLADNALGYVPFMVPAAILVFWLKSRRPHPPQTRDVVLDCFFALPLLFGVAFILVVTPSSMSWYFWLNRVDLLALPLLVTAAAIIFLGYQQVLHAWAAFFLLFFVWPYPIVQLQQELVDPFVSATVWFAERGVDFLALPYEAGAGSFVSTHLPADENYELVIGSVCSGTSIFIGFLLFGLVVQTLTQGTFRARSSWLGLGLLLAVLFNFIRVLVLLAVASQADLDLALDVVHPVLGLALFGVLLVLMLLLLRPLGLRWNIDRSGEHVLWQPTKGGGTPLRMLYGFVAGFAILTGVLDVQAVDYSFLGTGDGAPEIDVTSEQAILPQVPGWRLEHRAQVAWTDLFGADSRGDIFLYEHNEALTGVIVQTIVVSRRSTLDRYTIEQCVQFHGRKIEHLEYIALPYGVTGVLVHDTYNGIPSSSLYWQLPVRVGDELHHVRIALLLDPEEPSAPPLLDGPPVSTSLAGAVGIALANQLDTEYRGSDTLRREVDRQLLELGAQVIDQMVRTGGPAALLDAIETADAGAAAGEGTPEAGASQAATSTPAP